MPASVFWTVALLEAGARILSPDGRHDPGVHPTYLASTGSTDALSHGPPESIHRARPTTSPDDKPIDPDIYHAYLATTRNTGAVTRGSFPERPDEAHPTISSPDGKRNDPDVHPAPLATTRNTGAIARDSSPESTHDSTVSVIGMQIGQETVANRRPRRLQGQDAILPRRQTTMASQGQSTQFGTERVIVVCRMRPDLDSEVGQELLWARFPDPTMIEVLSPDTQEIRRFYLDRVFGNYDFQDPSYVSDALFRAAARGINACVILYGHEGSGAAIMDRLVTRAAGHFRSAQYPLKYMVAEHAPGRLIDLTVPDDPCLGHRRPRRINRPRDRLLRSSDVTAILASLRRRLPAWRQEDGARWSHVTVDIRPDGQQAGRIVLVDLAEKKDERNILDGCDAGWVNDSLLASRNILRGIRREPTSYISFDGTPLSFLADRSFTILLYVAVSPFETDRLGTWDSLQFADYVGGRST